MRWISIRRGHVLLGQVVIIQSGSQAATKELGFNTHFPLLGALGRLGVATEAATTIRAEVLYIIAVDTQPALRLPQDAYTRGDGIVC